MRAGRLVSLLLLLQTRGRMTARQLAERLEVSERTVYRDIEALSAAGVPVYCERGPKGGCALLDGERVDLSALTGLTPDKAAVLAALPPAIRSGTARARTRLHVDAPAFFRPAETLTFLPSLLEAAWNDHPVRARYRRADDRSVDRVLEPLGLVVKGGVWYVVARLGTRITAYRVSRFDHVEAVDKAFTRPKRFDLAAWWKEWSAEFESTRPKMAVTVRVAPFLIPELPGIFGESVRGKTGPPEGDGWSRLELTFESEEAALYRLLGLGTAVELVRPKSLRRRLRERAASVVRHYDASMTERPDDTTSRLS